MTESAKSWLIIGSVIIVSILISSTAKAEGWTKENIAWESGWAAAVTIDYFQTRNIISDPNYYEMINPILGHDPSIGSLNTLTAISLVGHWAISDYLTGHDRLMWQKSTVAVEVFNIGRNYYIGLSIRQ